MHQSQKGAREGWPAVSRRVFPTGGTVMDFSIDCASPRRACNCVRAEASWDPDHNIQSLLIYYEASAQNSVRKGEGGGGAA